MTTLRNDIFHFAYLISENGILLHLKSFSVLLVPQSAAAHVGSIETIILCFPILAILRNRPFAVGRKNCDHHVGSYVRVYILFFSIL